MILQRKLTSLFASSFRLYLSSRAGTGLNDQELEEVTNFFNSKKIKEKPAEYIVRPRLKPDFWIPASQVWEIGFQDMTKSLIYDVGRDSLGTGIALRFPKILRRRFDKSVQDVTTIAQVIDLYTRMNPKK